MTSHARIDPEPWRDAIAVYLVRDTGDGQRFILHGPWPGTLDLIEPGTRPEPTMQLDDADALALLDALAAHYRRATDTGTLRADYEAERRRVDRLTESVVASLAARDRADGIRLDNLAREVARDA